MLSGAMRRRLLLLALCSLVLATCATIPTTPVTSVEELAGKWQGTITLGFNGPQYLYYLTIHPDGTMEAMWGSNWQWGKITVANGAATFEMNDIDSGPVKYYAVPGGRTITMEPTFCGWYVQVSPVR